MTQMSHPTWVRGLKFSAYTIPTLGDVAPHVGAWIEIASMASNGPSGDVAPHVGAWIEISQINLNEQEAQRRTPRGCVD